MSGRRVVRVILLVFAIVGALYAQISELDLFTQKEVIVVTATKTAQKLEEAPSIMSAYLEKELREMPYDELVDFLNTVPGLVVSMAPDGRYRLTVRGQRAPGEVLVLIDGQKINDIYTGEGNYEIPLEWISRIEILRGPGSSLFGSNALTGIINIITKQPDNESKGHFAFIEKGGVILGDNTDNGIRKSLRLYAGYNGGLFRLDANLRLEDPFAMRVTRDIYADRDPNSLLYGGKTGYTYRKFNGANFKVSLKKDKFHAQIMSFYRKRDAYAGYTLWYAPGSDLKDNTLIGNLGFDYLNSEKVTSSFKLGGIYVIHDFLIKERPDGYIDPVSGDTFSEGMLTKEYYKEFTFNAENQINYNVSDNLLFSLGLQFEYSGIPDFYVYRNYSALTHEHYSELGNYDSLNFADIKNKARSVFAGYAQAIYRGKLMDRDWQVVLGGRYDKYSDVAEKMPFVPRISFMFVPVENLRIRLMYGGAFRAPTFKELYDRSSIGKDAIYGNETLKPEQIITPEAGIEWHLAKGVFRANVYQSKLKDIIRAFDPQGSGKYGWYENIGDIKSLGGEVDLRYALSDNIGIMANYSYVLPVFYWNREKLGTDFLASIGAYDGTWINNIPHYRATFGVRFNALKKQNGYALKSIIIGKYFGKRANNNRVNIETQHTVDIPSSFTFDVYLRYSIAKNVYLGLRGYNLIPSYYADPTETNDIDSYGEKGLIQPARRIEIEAGINI